MQPTRMAAKLLGGGSTLMVCCAGQADGQRRLDDAGDEKER
jgi:hypothetical protein